MNLLGKLFRKKSDPKTKKTAKIIVKLPNVNKKPLARKRIFVQTPFSHSTLKNKKHSRTSPEIQLNKLNEKHGKLYLTSRSIEQCKTKQKHKHPKKLTNKQSNKPDKNILIAKKFFSFHP